MAGDLLDGAQRDASAGHVGQACAAHGVAGGTVNVDCFEDFGEDFVGADALDVFLWGVGRGEEPGRRGAELV